MNRREFLAGLSASAFAGCASVQDSGVMQKHQSPCPDRPRFHFFSKMFQPPVTSSPEALCELMAKAGYDGIQWTVRKGGHVEPAHVAAELPRFCAMARSFGLDCTSICTDVKPDDACAETVLKTARDCGISLHRPAYFFYDAKNEDFRQSLARIRKGFAWLADLSGRCGVKATYQNHSSWGPSVFGGLVWDIYECIRDLDPCHIGVEYDPMHAYFETNLSWSHGLELISPWISSVDLKDFHYRTDPKNPKRMEKAMVPAGTGVVPWADVRRLLDAHGVRPLYIVHFEYDFDTSDLAKSVTTELTDFKRVLGF